MPESPGALLLDIIDVGEASRERHRPMRRMAATLAQAFLCETK
jgi:hypothetical protein